MVDYEQIRDHEKGEPVWKCLKCGKKYQKKTMVISHILNKH